MKTIGLYSYKGGAGKSLIAANLAVFLSRMGRSSIIVDADIESPSVHQKFGDAGWGATGRGGLVSLIESGFEPDKWDSRSFEEASPQVPADVQRYVYTLDSPRDPMKEASDKYFGSMFILPAGDVNHSGYWKTIRSPLWHEMFSLYGNYQTERGPTFKKYEPFLNYLRGIKSALSEIRTHPESDKTIEPDYMIVDFGSGADEMATTLINAWVDSLVYVLVFNDENINHLKGTFGRIAEAGEARHRLGISKDEFYIETVLSRVPQSIQYQGDHTLKRALKARHFDIDRMLVLHSDRDLEMTEELRCGYQTLPQNRRLTHDYMKLFGNLLQEQHCPVEGLEGVAKALDLPPRYEETERIFIHESPRGTLINPNDKSRNVSFKVETFRNLLEGVQRGLDSQLLEGGSNGHRKSATRSSREWLVKTLRSAGRECGEAFGKALDESFGNGRVGVQEKIQKWTEFDSDVGFGRFCFDELSIEIKGTRLVHCDVYLLESFLTAETDDATHTPDDHRFCDLMTGYIEGVLSCLLKADIVVEHHTDKLELPRHIEEEMANDPRSSSCFFAVGTPVCDESTQLEYANSQR